MTKRFALFRFKYFLYRFALIRKKAVPELRAYAKDGDFLAERILAELGIFCGNSLKPKHVRWVTEEARRTIAIIDKSYYELPSAIEEFELNDRVMKKFLFDMGVPKNVKYYHWHENQGAYWRDGFSIVISPIPESYPCQVSYICSDDATKTNQESTTVVLRYPVEYSAWNDGTAVIPLRSRVFYEGSPAYLEELWHPKKGYSLILRGLELVSPDRRTEERRRLLSGLATDPGGRPGGSSTRSSAALANKIIRAKHQRQEREKMLIDGAVALLNSQVKGEGRNELNKKTLASVVSKSRPTIVAWMKDCRFTLQILENKANHRIRCKVENPS